MSERRELGQVEIQGDVYFIVEFVSDTGTDLYDVIRCSDGQAVGRFRGTPTTMWLLEPATIEIDLLATIVRSAVADGVVPDLPGD